MNISIVIPIFNEQNNINFLLNEIFNLEIKNFEVIIVDDNSTDNSIKNLSLSNHYKKIKIIQNRNNKGQSFSIHRGIENSSFTNIVTIDGDCQNNPKDILKISKIYFSDNEIKLVGGIRKNRKDSLNKIFASKIANFVRRIYLDDKCADTGCSLKIFDKDIFLNFPYFDGIHRFLPALFRGYGYKTSFIDVDHRLRKAGYSKYNNINRFFRGIKDMLKVKKIIQKKEK